MGWMGGGDKIKEKKFLVDLEKNTYISEKSHQEIIDLAGLRPSGYDNYLKGWVKSDGTIKVWVESLEDIVFRYWDQAKLGFKTLIKEDLTSKKARTFAIVNRVERFAGTVKDFLDSRSKNIFYDEKMSYAVQFYGQLKIEKSSKVVMLVNYKLEDNRYILAGTPGKVLVGANGQAKKLRIKWKNTVSGYQKSRGGIELLTDRRLLTQV